jgi:hypothetical protein
LHIIDNTWVSLIILFSKKTKHEVHYFSLAFSPEKKNIYKKNYDAILLSKYGSAEKRY